MASQRARYPTSCALALCLVLVGGIGCGGKSRSEGSSAGMASGGSAGAASGAGGSFAGGFGGGGAGASSGGRAACDDIEGSVATPIASGTLSRSAETSCLVVDGRVACWGRGDAGQLGDGQLHPVATGDPVWVDSLDDAVSVGVGQGSACALRSAGSVECWGLGTWGALGDGSFHRSDAPYALRPVPVVGLTDAVGLSVGPSHACVLRSSGSVRCWGDGKHGQLGDGVAHYLTLDFPHGGVAAPVDALGIAGAVEVAVGGLHSCALLSDHTVWCWGMGLSGQLGDGSFHPGFEGAGTVLEPVRVLGIDDALQVSVGGAQTCALRASGRAACWGDPRVAEPTAFATDVCGSEGAVQISAGGAHVCAVLATGKAVCWGSGGSGQLGDGVPYETYPNGSTEPVSVVGLDDVSEISAGLNGTCARTSAGRVFCWGDGQYGELGTLDPSRSNVPLEVDGF